MLSRLFGKSPVPAIPQQLYGRLMAQARQPALFRDFGVPDTVMGRFDMLALHVYLFARRLRSEDSAVAVSLSQDVFDEFVQDIERALRELGIGDTTVPKRKKAMIRSLYGQIEDFDDPLASGDEELLLERLRSRYLGDSPQADGRELTSYVMKTANELADMSFNNLLKGEVEFARIEHSTSDG